MSIDAFDLVLIAFFTGIGNAIGQPVGKWIHEKVQEHRKKFEEIINLPLKK